MSTFQSDSWRDVTWRDSVHTMYAHNATLQSTLVEPKCFDKIILKDRSVSSQKCWVPCVLCFDQSIQFKPIDLTLILRLKKIVQHFHISIYSFYFHYLFVSLHLFFQFFYSLKFKLVVFSKLFAECFLLLHKINRIISLEFKVFLFFLHFSSFENNNAPKIHFNIVMCWQYFYCRMLSWDCCLKK